MTKGALEPAEVDALISAYHQPPTMLAVAHFLSEQRRTFEPPRTAKPAKRRPMRAPSKPSIRVERRVKRRGRRVPAAAGELAAFEHNRAM